MKSPIDSRARFVETAATLMRRQGYHGTGLSQIVRESGAPKGSLYFHFPGGKEELAVAALEASGGLMHQQLEEILESARSPLAAVTGVVTVLADNLEASNFLDGCPVATVALEASAQSDSLQAACSASYSRWQDVISKALVRMGFTKAGARGSANLVLCAVEGAMLISRAHRDTTPLRSLPAQLKRVLAAG